MASLFVVATPLQMLIAQQLVRQEQIKDAVLLESYFSKHPDFLKSYDMCRIDSLWKKRLSPVCDFPSWDNQGVNLLKTALRTWKRYKKLQKMMKSESIDSIYLADFQNQTYRFMTVFFSKKGYGVNFFEEGYSHYVPRVCHLREGLMEKMKESIIDGLYFMPLYHIRFAYWRNNPNCYYIGLPIHARYSVVPNIHSRNYDKCLVCQPMVSEKLSKYLANYIDSSVSEKRYLLLTDPMTEVLPRSFKSLYFDVIKQNLKDLGADSVLYVKFHPRDIEEDKTKTINLIETMGIRYKILSSEVNVPVEYFLLNIHFEGIFFFNTSTVFYNGYLFPKCTFIKLLPSLYEFCKSKGVPSYHLEQMRLLVEKMN